LFTSSPADNARYCLIRLVLRKPDQWHALSSLGSYKKEVGEVGLIRAITDLCKPWAEVMNRAKDVKEEMDVGDVDLRKDVKGVIDLTFDEDEDVKIPPIHVDVSSTTSTTRHSSRSSSTLSSSDFPENGSICEDDFPEVPLDSFCYDENSMDATELLGRLSVKQLKDLIKATKTKSAKNNVREWFRVMGCNV
jgi:Fanconi-associated nuclease 1